MITIEESRRAGIYLLKYHGRHVISFRKNEMDMFYIMPNPLVYSSEKVRNRWVYEDEMMELASQANIKIPQGSV